MRATHLALPAPRRGRAAAALAAACLALAIHARGHAEPRPGQPLPGFAVADLVGHRHDGGELRGRPTLLIAITGSSAGAAVERWLAALRAVDAGAEARAVSLVALRITMLAPDALVWDQARAHAPRARWTRTWLSRDGNLQSALGLPDNDGVPYVFVLDAAGRVVVSLHTDAAAVAVRAVSSALAAATP